MRERIPLGPDGHAPEEQVLLEAFHSFSETASSLEHSYGLLRAEVARLTRELEESHSGLARSLEENRRMREYLDRLLEYLPCGVLALSGQEISRANPEARRLLGIADDARKLSWSGLQAGVRALLERARESEQEQPASGWKGRIPVAGR